MTQVDVGISSRQFLALPLRKNLGKEKEHIAMVSSAFGGNLQTPDLQQMTEDGKHPATGFEARLNRMWMV